MDHRDHLLHLHKPHICHGRHARRPCKFFLAGVNFYRFNAKNWHFRQILREKVAFFTDLTRKIGVSWCKFYSPKILPVKKMTNIRYVQPPIMLRSINIDWFASGIRCPLILLLNEKVNCKYLLVVLCYGVRMALTVWLI